MQLFKYLAVFTSGVSANQIACFVFPSHTRSSVSRANYAWKGLSDAMFGECALGKYTINKVIPFACFRLILMHGRYPLFSVEYNPVNCRCRYDSSREQAYSLFSLKTPLYNKQQLKPLVLMNMDMGRRQTHVIVELTILNVNRLRL